MLFQLGDRVRIKDPNHWAKGATGVVSQPPELARCVAPGWGEYARDVDSEGRPAAIYWIQFDTPQNDAEAEEGEGPYDGSEVEEQFLEKV